MRQIDAQYTEWPFLGSRKLAQELGVNRKRVQRLMRMMGIAGIVPRRRTTTPHPGHKKYPYLLRNLEVLRPDQVWCSDITYIPLQHGFLYLVAVMDWFSRYVISWRLSNTLEGERSAARRWTKRCHLVSQRFSTAIRGASSRQ